MFGPPDHETVGQFPRKYGSYSSEGWWGRGGEQKRGDEEIPGYQISRGRKGHDDDIRTYQKGGERENVPF